MEINREKVVTSHNITLTGFGDPLSVGNGNFAFTADITGLQSFSERYEEDIPLCTMTHWGLHTTQPEKFSHREFKPTYFDSNNRKIPMNSSKHGQEECYDWLRENPHRMNLGRIGFLLDGLPLKESDISEIKQTLNLWEGILHSSFLLAETPVTVRTTTHGTSEAVGFFVQSTLLEQGRLTVQIQFPYGSPTISGANWDQENQHRSSICETTKSNVQILRILDADCYFCNVNTEDFEIHPEAPHHYILTTKKASAGVTFGFGEAWLKDAPSYSTLEESGKSAMIDYWSHGGFIDFSRCTDERAKEMSRRTILSMYVTKIQCSGDYPPQETGLTVNSWYGKAHLEMHYWHSIHFTHFNRPELLERSLWWYHAILDEAVELASSQGFQGARWPKMPWFSGRDSPSPIAPFLLWQQPHPINYIYCIYRSYLAQGQEKVALRVLEEHQDIIKESADFMASFAHYDSSTDRYVLGPAIIPAQENHAAADTLNPTFELEYWHFGLSRSLEMFKLLGKDAPDSWSNVLEKLSKPTSKDGKYLAHEQCPDTYSKFNVDHPSFLCALGMLPGELCDKETMRNSLHEMMTSWTFQRLWGWDFPVIALCAARLGEPHMAIEALLMDSPKNTYRQNGHNQQVSRPDLPLYLPGNGGFLLAMAGLCAGFGEGEQLQGFPKDGKWNVVYENINSIV